MTPCSLQKTQTFLTQYKENGFQSAQLTAKKLAAELEMTQDEMNFPAEASVRRKRTKKQFSYEAEDESMHDPKEKFRIEFFKVLMDQAIMSLKERFKQLTDFSENFGFLFVVSNLKDISDNDLKKQCMDLQLLLSEQKDAHDESDINGLDLFTELKTLTNIIPNNMKPLGVLRFIYNNRLNETLPNVSIALQILLTIPVTVASGERSFLKLKLIKTFLRSTMTQERLVGLALISIENDIAVTLDYSDLILNFASKKARKITF